jgi:pilus assembly protein CpaB
MFESKRRAFLFMLGSIFFGLVAVILFADYMSDMKASLGEYATVHVAKTDIAAGMPITDDMMAEEQIPRKFMLDSLISSKEEVRGKISLVPIAEGSVITASMLRDNTIVTGDLRQVMLRAPLAVFDDQIDTFDKVDLVVSYDAGSGEAQEDKRVTKVLLRDVTVNRVDKKGEELVAIGVVLKLDDAQQVIWSLNYGKEVRVLKSGRAKVQQEASNGAIEMANEQEMPANSERR